jgi:NAD(P)-dependent dehydrogenase (short-subunit alcohol dehydrogenase family)
MDWVRRVHRQIHDLVVDTFTADKQQHKQQQQAVSPPLAPPRSIVVHLECDKLTPETCEHAAQLIAERDGRASVDCLLWDDAGMARLCSAVPASRLVLDFTEVFRMPDLQ